MRIGVGVSTAADARQAAVEAAAHARDELAGAAPSLAVLLVSRSHTDNAIDILDAVQATVEPPALIGCVAQAVVAGSHEIEDEPTHSRRTSSSTTSTRTCPELQSWAAW